MSDELNRAAPIAAQLDQDAKSLYESWQHKQPNRCSIPPWEKASEGARAEWRETAAARSAPAAAQLDAELPQGMTVMRLADECGSATICYTAKQVHEAQVAALAKYCGADVGGTQLITRLMAEVNDLRSQNVEYAERIRLLERELKATRTVSDQHFDTILTLRADIDGRTAGTAPEGWQLVPVEPTMAMIAALGWEGDELLAIGHGLISQGIADQYKAALAAAPSPQENTK